VLDVLLHYLEKYEYQFLNARISQVSGFVKLLMITFVANLLLSLPVKKFFENWSVF